MNNYHIKLCNVIKYLGVYFDKRLKFDKHIKFVTESKPNLIFSDEKKFTLNNNDKDEFVTRKVNSNAYQDKFINYDKQVSSSADINIWSYIGPFGKGVFFILF